MGEAMGERQLNSQMDKLGRRILKMREALEKAYLYIDNNGELDELLMAEYIASRQNMEIIIKNAKPGVA